LFNYLQYSSATVVERGHYIAAVYVARAKKSGQAANVFITGLLSNMVPSESTADASISIFTYSSLFRAVGADVNNC